MGRSAVTNGRILPPGVPSGCWQSFYFTDVYKALCAEHGIDLVKPGPENLLHREIAWQVAALHLQARTMFPGVHDGRNWNAFNKTLSTALKLRERLARLLPPVQRAAPAAVPPVPKEPPPAPTPVPPPAKRLARTSTPEGAAHARAARAHQAEEQRRQEEDLATNGPPPIHPTLIEAARKAYDSGPLGTADERVRRAVRKVELGERGRAGG